MPELIIDVTVTVTVETNKGTYVANFMSLGKAARVMTEAKNKTSIPEMMAHLKEHADG